MIELAAHLQRQFRDLLNSLSWAQRVSFALVPVAILAGLFFLVRSGSEPLSPVGFGREFGDQEVVSLIEQLRTAGLTEIERRDGQLFVPDSQIDRANALLMFGGTGGQTALLPPAATATPRSGGLFATRSEREALRDEDLKLELNRIIAAVPGIRQATVRWAREAPSSRFDRSQKRKATVFVLPENERSLRPELVHALRFGVASAVSELEPESVTVFDISNGRAHTAGPDELAESDRLIQQARNWSQSLERQIEDQLAYIPGIQIAVSVRWDRLQWRRPETVSSSTAVTTPTAERSPVRQANAVAVIANGSPVSMHEPDQLELTSAIKPTVPGGVVTSNQPLRIESHSAATRQRAPAAVESEPSSFAPSDALRGSTATDWSDAFQVMVAIPAAYYHERMRSDHAGVSDAPGWKSDEVHQRQLRAQVEQEVARAVQEIAGRSLADVDVRSLGVIDAAEAEAPGQAIRGWLPVAAVPFTALLGLCGYGLWRERRRRRLRAGAIERRVLVKETAMTPPAGTTEQTSELDTLVADSPERVQAVLEKWLGSSRS